MKIIFSGVQCDEWRAAASEERERGRAVEWLEPKELLVPSNAGKVPSDARVVWLFHSPIDAAMAVEGGQSAEVEAALASWLQESRSALNLKRQLGSRLSFADGSRLSVGALCDALEQGPPQEPEATVGGGGDMDARAALMLLLGQCDARYIEVYDALNAASQFGGDTSPDAASSVAGWNQVIDVIDAVRLADQSVSIRSLLESELEEGRSSAIKREQEHQELFRRKEEESEVLLSQLHLAQEELQRCVLRLKEAERLERAGAGQPGELEQMAHALAALRQQHERQEEQLEQTGREAKLLSTQLQEVQKELDRNFPDLREVEQGKMEGSGPLGEASRQFSTLQLQLKEATGRLRHLASREPDLSIVATRRLSSTLARRLARKLLPGAVMRHRGSIAAKRELDRTLAQIRSSLWFDADWYLASYQDVREAGTDPAEHYHVHGWKEGRNPGPGFDTVHYLDSNPDVRRTGLNPLLHFIRHGADEGRKPMPTPEDVR